MSLLKVILRDHIPVVMVNMWVVNPENSENKELIPAELCQSWQQNMIHKRDKAFLMCRLMNELLCVWLFDTFCCLRQIVVLWLCPYVNGFIHNTNAELCMVSKYTVACFIYYRFTNIRLYYATLYPPLVSE